MKIKDIFGELINHPVIRVLMLCSMTIIIGILSNKVFDGEKLPIIILVILGLIYIALEGYYAYIADKKQKKEIAIDHNIKSLSEKNEMYRCVFDSFRRHFEDSATALNKITKEAIETKTFDMDKWNSSNDFEFICDSIFKAIEKLDTHGDKFSVSIIYRDIQPESTVYWMIARRSYSGEMPNIYNCGIEEKDAKPYFYCKFFLNNQIEPEYLMTKDEVDQAFYFKENSKHKGEYTQYIGIPVACSGNHVIALLQIIGHKGSYITNDKESLIDTVNSLVYPYVKYGVLMHKIERCFTVCFEGEC